MLSRDRAVAVITLCLLNIFTLGAGAAVAKITPDRKLSPQPPAVASRELIRAGPVAPAPPPSGRPPAGLAARLTSLLGGSRAPINAVVIDASSRQILFDQRAGVPATPASTTKLVTSVAALSTLGPQHRLTTKVVRGQGGVITLVGGGDPTLTARPPSLGGYPRYASLIELARATAAALKATGVTRVRVDYDASLFEGARTAPGWKPNYLPDGEVAPVTALAVDEGRLGPWAKRRVADPPDTATGLFARLLGRFGVRAAKGRRTIVRQTRGAAQGTPGEQLAAVRSPTVSTLVEHLMTASDNDMAEAMIRHVAIRRGRPPTFAGGALAVQEVLGGLGIGSGVLINDGSGLSTRNRITPRALADIAALAASPGNPELRAAITGMPVAGFSGTLARRYAGPATLAGAGAVRAKTGTLAGVSTLAGVAHDADGRLLAFAFMLGNGRGQVDPARLDLLAASVAACGCG